MDQLQMVWHYKNINGNTALVALCYLQSSNAGLFKSFNMIYDPKAVNTIKIFPLLTFTLF